MVHFPHGEMRARNGDRVSFPRWGKRNVVSHHFTELVLEITEMRMLTIIAKNLLLNTCSDRIFHGQGEKI